MPNAASAGKEDGQGGKPGTNRRTKGGDAVMRRDEESNEARRRKSPRMSGRVAPFRLRGVAGHRAACATDGASS